MDDLKQRLIFIGIFSMIYISFFYFIVGWRQDHLLLLLAIGGLALAHKYGYQAVLALSGLIGWTILYDAMSASYKPMRVVCEQD